MNRCYVLMMAVILGFLLMPDAQAKDKGVGHGRGHGRPDTTTESVKKAGRRVVDEAVDAVVDELIGEDQAGVTPSGMPPGLSKKGKLPPGLEKKGKVPPGWSKGKKEGWDQIVESSQKQEGVVRRLIKGIFRGRKSAPPAPADSE